jgi:hypothetical protein
VLAFATQLTSDGDLEQAGDTTLHDVPTGPIDHRFASIKRNSNGAISLQVRHEQQSKQQWSTSHRKAASSSSPITRSKQFAGAQQTAGSRWTSVHRAVPVLTLFTQTVLSHFLKKL